jgi:class 3 adenylate cyclase
VEARANVQYARSGDLSIGYTVHGRGPFDIVYVPGFISNLDLMSEVPFFRHILERLSAFGRVITFDKRGTGVSDRTLGHGSVAERMDDIRAVMDAAGSREAALVGVSEGGPISLAFAASSPERVRGLVLWGTYAAIARADDYPGRPFEDLEREIDVMVDLWGQGESLRFFISGMPTDEATYRLIGRYERGSASPALVREILLQNCAIDVRSALPAITAPTLVIHRTGDQVVPVQFGRYMAERIDRARFVELPGAFHLDGSPGGERDALDRVESFLTGTTGAREHIDRVLATVLFTDIVDSTGRAAELGDRRWREVLDAHDAVVRQELERANGREVNTTGDGFLAVFDGPARAVRCAAAIVRTVRAFGVEIRAGVHTGETEVRGDDVAGMAVHIGARVMGFAGPGEVIVTSTVRDLVVGSGIGFEDRGRHALKGVPGEWQLLAVQE